MILFAWTGLPGICSKANSYVKKKKKYLVSDLYRFFVCGKFIHSFCFFLEWVTDQMKVKQSLGQEEADMMINLHWFSLFVFSLLQEQKWLIGIILMVPVYSVTSVTELFTSLSYHFVFLLHTREMISVPGSQIT
jgi:hypothetical protein